MSKGGLPKNSPQTHSELKHAFFGLSLPFAVRTAFAPVSTVKDLWKYQAMFIGIQCIAIAMGVYKCKTMGLVPTKVLIALFTSRFITSNIYIYICIVCNYCLTQTG